ncbi:MAG: prolyl oligopeptidase family serine peptidase [Candidatus Aminicenantes bacterium]|nr:prolyl oligopeptidase family serine peptidase [Candidatus Aminicenantes bacterium]NIM81487.1 prolyl oligopeptidase family serine peptidase [Candidatus Aminicenantes bacterium]NIN20853.1 prolyl oligopeptidase family serine peptidase [Candidatus Aminicenantes bacterium]NIN44674.1 prolyl oligopeptidase family serine peptidase [Candidatus Aminicenantes bacterium]NIN87482.1 prolyl oligopeptidase family serine peptidase [Candidatus Aminicenantes bacterium]
MNKSRLHYTLVSIITLLFVFPTFLLPGTTAEEVFSAHDVLKTRTCDDAQISPDGQWIAYTVTMPRCAREKPGSAYKELYLVSSQTKQIKPFITGKVSVGTLRWSPDSSRLAFLTQRGEKAKTQVWVIPADGGEAIQVTRAKTSVSNFQWHPKENKIAYIATTPSSKREKELKEKGYDFIFYEENLKHRNLYLVDVSDKKTKPKQLTENKTVWNFVFSPDGKTIAAAVSPKNLVDHRYMFQKIYLLDIASGKMEQLTDNPGKLGNFNFSPDGTKLAYTAALWRKDHAVSQVYVIDIKTKEQKNLTVPDFRGHVSWAHWKDNNTVLYYAGEGVWPTLNLVPASGGKRAIILNSEKTGITFRGGVSFTKDFKHFAFVGSSPRIPGEVFYWKPGKKAQQKVHQLTNLNPWLSQRKLGKQGIIRYQARDGLEIEGLLLYPVNYQESQKYPLIVVVHGGPESHYSNSWVTRYSRPGQVFAGKGYVVFYPNYRASTGYGVKFALEGYKDPAGKEFDDIADGIEYLIKKGIADPERVGLGGGSYGGYAAAWFASYYTKYVRAVCMFVGISDVISKRGTTDIPYEELYVHSGDSLEDMWELNLKRSPVYYAHKSKTAVLILGGTADTRVHPSQSLEFYRRLKMNNHPAVRLVRYPGEGHGNRNQPGRIDVLYRTLQWYDWYVKDKKPLDGPMPPLDISDNYGLDLK